MYHGTVSIVPGSLVQHKKRLGSLGLFIELPKYCCVRLCRESYVHCINLSSASCVSLRDESRSPSERSLFTLLWLAETETPFLKIRQWDSW